MDQHVKDFYRQASDGAPQGSFHKVMALHEMPTAEWKSLSKEVPALPRGWFELARLDVRDRIDFTRDFWISKLPFHPKLSEFLNKFFANFDDIGIYITQRKYDDPFEVSMVYSIKENGGYFRGAPPATDSAAISLQKKFTTVIFPADYISFLQIHDGFGKTTDTGIIPTARVAERTQDFQGSVLRDEPLLTCGGDQVNPKSLIPFYESFGMPFFQCFWAEWYPENEMGNVYYSDLTKTVSDIKGSDPSCDMAFATFTDWLMFYLETFN